MSKSGASTATVSPPSGTGAVAGMGESFSLDLNSGQGTLSLPFELPDGVAGFKPTVKLEYTHGNGNGPFGFGWTLQMRRIDRRLDFGVPGVGVEEIFLDSDIELRQAANGDFHPVREMAFSHYERDGDHWVVTERDGTRHLFGVTAAARLADPDHPDRIQTWLLEHQEDVNGNIIDYTYTTLDDYPYLSEIRYARFVVRFSYEARPDIVVNGRAGFVRRISRRCRAIALHLTAGDRLVRTLAFTYSAAPLSNISLLTAAQLTGHGDGQPDVSKSPMQLAYTTFAPEHFDVRQIESRPGDPVPPPLSDPEAALVALDDLPLPGILTNRGGWHYYWPNDGTGRWSSPRVLGEAPFASSFRADGIQFVDMDGTGTADMLVGVGSRGLGSGSNTLNGYYQNRGRSGFADFVAYPRGARVLPPFESGRVRLGELDGDGVVDAIYSAQRGLVNFRNRGRSGWAESAISANTPQVDFVDPLTFLADMTGDGLPDIVRVRSGEVEYWVNIGHGRFGERVVMANSPRLAGISLRPEQILLLDVDGDGCSDLVRISAEGVELYISQSGRSFADPVRYPTLPVPIPGTVRAVDMDGRGAAGLLYNSLRGGRSTYVYLTWARSTPPYLLHRVDNGVGLVSDIEYAPMVEMALRDRAEGRA